MGINYINVAVGSLRVDEELLALPDVPGLGPHVKLLGHVRFYITVARLFSSL